MLNALRSTIRTAHDYLHSNPLGEERTAEPVVKSVPCEARADMPPEIISRVTQQARELYFAELTPQYAALASHALAPDAKYSPNLHRFLREKTLAITPIDNAETVSIKLEAYRALTHNLPAVDREPGEEALPKNQRAIARAHLVKLLYQTPRRETDGWRDAADPALQINQSRLETLAETAVGAHEWFEVARAANALHIPRGSAAAISVLSKLSENIPPDARKLALVSLAQLYGKLAKPESTQLAAFLERNLRPVMEKNDLADRTHLLKNLNLSPVSRRDQLVQRQTLLNAESAALKAELHGLTP